MEWWNIGTIRVPSDWKIIRFMGPARHCPWHPIINLGIISFFRSSWYNHDINRRGRRVNKPLPMHILRSPLAYSLRGVSSTLRPVSPTGWKRSRRPRHRILRFEKFFDIKKGSALADLGMPWLPRRGGYPWHLYQHSWRNCKIDPNAPEAHKKPWSKHWSYAFLTIIPW